MRSASSSEGSQLVRIAVPCAQTRVAIASYPGPPPLKWPGYEARVAIEMHS